MAGPNLYLIAVDGVLVDSSTLRVRCWAETLRNEGFPIDRDTFQRRFEGRSDATVLRSVEEELGRQLSATVLAEFERRARLAYERELRPVPDIRGTLRRLRAPVCALAGSFPGLARHALEVTGLWSSFAPNVFTATAVDQEPPAPDLARFAAAEMGAPVARCLLVDSTVIGVRCGLAAGMTVFGFAGGFHAAPETHAKRLRDAGATIVFDRMAELAPLANARAA